ncbi:MAG: 5'-nucleotidase C-terminal domain-containing protein [Pseudomonadota bacterium]
MTLRIMATTDLHGSLVAHDYFHDADTEPTGLWALKPVIDALRADDHPSLLLDNGDFLQGSPLTDMTALRDEFFAHHPHPVIAMMNDLGFDAIGLGNHEFNFGLDILRKAVSDADAPILCCNLTPVEGPPLAVPFLLRKLADGGPTVGIISTAPPQITSWDRIVLQGSVATEPMVPALTRTIDAARGAGADIIVVLCHSGLGAADGSDAEENLGRLVARMDGVDALILGHTHEIFPDSDLPPDTDIDLAASLVHVTPTMQPAAFGAQLGVMDLDLDHNPKGTWRVVGSKVRLLEPTLPPETPPAPAVRVAHERTLETMRRPVGTSEKRLHNYFARVANCETIQVVCDAQRFALANEIAHSAFADLPVLSFAAPYRSRVFRDQLEFVDIPAGPIARHHVYELYPYPNLLCAARMTGSQIEKWLNIVAQHFNPIKAGGGAQALLNDHVPGYAFDVVDGLTYSFDLAGQPQAVEICHNGHPVRAKDEFVVLGNSYRLGGAGLGQDAPPEIIMTNKLPIHISIAEFFSAHDPLQPVAREIWSLAPIAGATGLFQTAPAAQDLAVTRSDRSFADMGLISDGLVLQAELNLS